MGDRHHTKVFELTIITNFVIAYNNNNNIKRVQNVDFPMDTQVQVILLPSTLLQSACVLRSLLRAKLKLR